MITSPTTRNSETSLVPGQFRDSPAALLSHSQIPSVDLAAYFFPDPNNSVYAALFNNGRMLGLECNICVPSKSIPASSNIPLTLHPTPLQLSTSHHTWFDRFPFPRMRDNMISLGSLFDAEDFLSDLFNMVSFKLKPGGVSWDPEVWMISCEFEEKWGYLFY